MLEPPSPSSPIVSSPKHHTLPSSLRTHVPSATTSTSTLSVPTCAEVSGPVELPSWSRVLSPQHRTSPVASTAQLWSLAVAICVAPSSTRVGVATPVPTLGDTAPLSLSPQHHTAPVVVRTHAMPDAATSWTPARSIADRNALARSEVSAARSVGA